MTTEQLKEQFKKETGSEAIIFPVCHGDAGYASYEYQQWLENKLSEHSTKEPVAWLCEKEVLGKKVYELVMYRSQADTLMERGYTITPLVKKTV